MKNDLEKNQKTTSLLASYWQSQFCWSFWLSPTQAASGPALQRPLDSLILALTLLPTMGASVGPSLIRTLLDGCGLSSPELHSPRSLDVGCCPLHPHGCTGWPGEEETGDAVVGEFPTVPPSVFFFLRQSSCSILLLHTRKGLSSHTAHLSS